ncbi:hypothetical protein LCGC14_2658270, partial [marine sediment metagenome]
MSDFDWTEYEIPEDSPGLHAVEKARLDGDGGRYQRCCCYFDDDNDGLPVTMCNHHRAVLDELRSTLVALEQAQAENSKSRNTIEAMKRNFTEMEIMAHTACDRAEQLEKQDEIHWKTRRGHLRTVDAWKRINKDARNKLRAVVCGYFNDTGAEPSVSVLGRAVDEAKDFLQATRSDSPHYKRTQTAGESAPGFSIDKQFTCPKCKGHCFGTQNATDCLNATGYCNGRIGSDVDGYQCCGFEWLRTNDNMWFSKRQS